MDFAAGLSSQAAKTRKTNGVVSVWRGAPTTIVRENDRLDAVGAGEYHPASSLTERRRNHVPNHLHYVICGAFQQLCNSRCA